MDRPSEARLKLREKPETSSVMYQKWEDLLFLHWAFPAEIVQNSLPPGLFVDTFDGLAWVAVVPFAMSGVRPKGMPALPVISNFLELNVRTYAHDGKGNYGVWFYSLEANRRLAVWAARTFFHLPYFPAKMEMKKAGEAIYYSSKREGVPETQEFEYQIAPTSTFAKPETLEFFLIERYLLFSHQPKTGANLKGRVHHAPYALFTAHAPQWSTWGIAAAGLPEPRRAPDSILYSPRVEVEVFGLQK